MDYLSTSGTRFSVVKIKQTDRDILRRGDSRLLPKTIQFHCSKRPDPNCQYELSSSFWVAPVRIPSVKVRIQSVKESDNHNYVVDALVLGPIEISRIQTKLLPGLIHFKVNWSSGEFSGDHIHGIEAAIRLFSDKIHRVPPAERELASGRMEGEIRAPHGGFRRVKLATWHGTEPLHGFFQTAKLAWRKITRPFDQD